MTEFRFTNEHRTSGIGTVVDVLRSPRLWIPAQRDYPDYDNWLLKTEADIIAGSKRAMLARMNSQAIGAVIYQADGADPGTLNIRNISLSPDARGRHIGSFLVRNVEIEARRHEFPDSDQVSVDTKAANTDMIQFLLVNGYRVQAIKDLYGLGAGLDVVLTKPLASSR